MLSHGWGAVSAPLGPPVCQQLFLPELVLYSVTDLYSRGVKFSTALRVSGAAESPVIYVLLSESSRFKSEVSGQGSVQYVIFVSA